MRVLFSGSWGDTHLVDLVIGGLKDSNKGFPQEQVEVLWDDNPASKRAAAMAEARHRLVPRGLEPGEWPQMVFVCHDSLPGDEKELQRLLEWNLHGIPIYHIRHMDRETIQRLLSVRRGASSRPTPRVPRSRPLRGGRGTTGG